MLDNHLMNRRFASPHPGGKNIVKTIMTVCGPIPSDKIGLTSMHDHILADLSFFKQPITDDIERDSPIDLNSSIEMKNLCYLRNGLAIYCSDNWNLKDVDLMTKEVQYFKERGGNTILEPSAPGIRCNTEKLKYISENTNVNIIASTGLYREETWPVNFIKMGSSDIQSYLLNEINYGINGTDIKAGHIKTAIANGSENEFNFLKAVVPVANKTGLMVTAHTSYGTTIENRRKMLQTFLQEGMKPEKLLFCHVQYTFTNRDVLSFLQNPELCKLDLTWAKEVLDKGANVCIDLFGYPSDNEILDCFGRADTVKLSGLIGLINSGYAEQLVIGNDVYQKIMLRSYGGHGYCRIIDYVIPALIDSGIDKKTIDKIIIFNPTRLLQH
jgi:phosphotriesterase-related protein